MATGRRYGTIPLPPTVNKAMSRMSRFTSRRPLNNLPSEIYAIAKYGPDEQVEFVTTARSDRVSAVIFTCLTLCNETGISNLQICSYYLSAVRALFVGLDPLIRDFLGLIGAGLVVITDAQMDTCEFQLRENRGILNVIVMLFSSILILFFKNTFTSNYTAHMADITRELKEAVGAGDAVLPQGMTTLIDMRAAGVIRTTLGAHNELRAMIVKVMLRNESTPGPIGNACGHLTGKVEWTDMESLVVIFETLLLTRSPVIHDPRVASEIVALSHIFSVINCTESPQYFGIFHTVSDRRIMDRAKYSIILAVAHRCKSALYMCSSVSEFFSPVAGRNTLVEALVVLHNNYMARVGRPTLPKTIGHLFTYEPPDDQAEPAAAV